MTRDNIRFDLPYRHPPLFTRGETIGEGVRVLSDGMHEAVSEEDLMNKVAAWEGSFIARKERPDRFESERQARLDVSNRSQS